MIRALGRSLQVQLALGFALMLTVLVGGSGLFLYTSIKSIVYGQLHKEFTSAARLIVHKLDEDHLPLDKEILDVGDHFLVRVSDLSSRVLLETPGMDKKFPAICAPPGSGSWVWIDGPASPDRSPRTLHARYRDGWVQLSRDIKPEEALLSSFFSLLLLVIGVSPFLGWALGHWLVRLGLKPLKYLETEARNLRPESLKIRIDAALLPSELAPLAMALNSSIARLEGAFQRLGELNSDLAHELRTPVHSLRLETEGILATGGLPEQAEEQMVGMMATLDHMATLIEQMLFLARSEDPATQVVMSPIHVRALLETVREPFEPLAEETFLTLKIEMDGELEVRGNGTLLRRALHNLLANAIRHSHQGGEIILRAQRDRAGLTLSVEDHGEGIPAQFLGSLGQRFVRTDLSRSRKGGGAGLGLAIVQGIAKIHGASLRVQSTEGVGTVAQITFPAS